MNPTDGTGFVETLPIFADIRLRMWLNPCASSAVLGFCLYVLSCGAATELVQRNNTVSCLELSMSMSESRFAAHPLSYYAEGRD